MKNALYIPVCDEETDTWCVQTEHGFEIRDIRYVAGEFSGSGLIYHSTGMERKIMNILLMLFCGKS